MSLWSLLLIGCGSLAGCGSGVDTVPAEGVLTYKGKPVPDMAVTFMPQGGKGQMATGETDAEGKFKLQTRVPGDGAMVGDYQVSFQAMIDVPENEPAAMPGFPGYEAPKSPLPPKYADSLKSGVTASVTSDASKNVFTFDLE